MNVEWLPADWRVVRLDAVADLLSGGTPSKSRPEWWRGSIPWASPKDMKRLRLRDVQDHISEEALRQGSRLVPAKTIFVVVRGMILAKDLPVAMAEVPMAFNQDMKAVLAKDEADPEYLLYALASQRQALIREIGTSAHGTRRIGSSSLEALLLPLPPKGEQEAIAAVLRRLEAAVEIQGRIVVTLKKLKATIMAKLFREGLRGEPQKPTDIGEIPESWEVRRLGDIVELITKGSSPKWQGFEYCETGVLFVRSQNIGHGELLLDEVAYLSEDFNRKERRSILSAGDLLTNIVGASIGRVAVADARVSGANINQAVALARLPPASHNPVFLMHFLMTGAGLNQMHRQKKEIARANLSLEDVASFLVPIPSRSEQDEIAHSIESVGRRMRVAERDRHSLQAIFSSVLRLLMTGGVRVKRGQVDGTGAQADMGGDYRDVTRLPESVERFLSELVRRFDPERVILFGSSVPGSPSAKDGVGLLVIMPFEGRSLAQAVRIEREIGHDFSLEVVVLRPEEVERAVEMGNPFIKRILGRGRTLYVRPAGRTPSRRERALREGRLSRHGTVSEETLGDIVRRIVEVVAPEKIILFGSAARGEMGPDSDVDLMVVKACADRREVARTIRRHLIGVAPGLPKDVIVVTPEELERYRDTIGLIYRPALQEGRVVYAA